MSSQPVGFVGLGMMGLPMAENLARPGGGVRVLAHDRVPAARDAAARVPGWGDTLAWADSLAGLGACEVVITMLPDSAATNAAAAVLQDALAPGATLVDMGSSNPVETRALAARLAQRGIALVDAPVSGGVAKARTGTLAIMAGGDAAAVARVRPLLQRMGSTLIETGAVGSAHAMKALNNYVYAAGLLAMAEALNIARHAGLDLEVLADVLNASSGRNVATETKLRQFVLPRTFDGGFAMRLQAKDLATARALGLASGCEAPQLALCASLWQDALATVAHGADNTEIVRFVEQLPRRG
jgi:3-hydroxyisobutyrate dehydrogenase